MNIRRTSASSRTSIIISTMLSAACLALGQTTAPSKVHHRFSIDIFSQWLLSIQFSGPVGDTESPTPSLEGSVVIAHKLSLSSQDTQALSLLSDKCYDQITAINTEVHGIITEIRKQTTANLSSAASLPAVPSSLKDLSAERDAVVMQCAGDLSTALTLLEQMPFEVTLQNSFASKVTVRPLTAPPLGGIHYPHALTPIPQ